MGGCLNVTRYIQKFLIGINGSLTFLPFLQLSCKNIYVSLHSYEGKPL